MLELIKKAQAGDQAARAELALMLWPEGGGGLAQAVIDQICGKFWPGFIDQKSGDQPAVIVPFGFDDDELEAVFNKSLDYALKTYKHDKGMKFSTWFYNVFYGRLYNLKGEYIKRQYDGETLRTLKRYLERARDILGDPFDENIIKQETSFNDELLEGMSKQEKSYCALMLNCYRLNMNLTDETAGQVLGVSRRQVLRYKAGLRGKLESMPEAWTWPVKTADELPDLVNEYGAIDPVPRQAAKNINRDVTLNCMKGEKVKHPEKNGKGFDNEKV